MPRQAIVTCQLVVDRQADRLSLSIGHWPLHFDLFEVSSSERKTELQHFIFWLADLSTDLKARLQGALVLSQFLCLLIYCVWQLPIQRLKNYHKNKRYAVCTGTAVICML